MGCQMDKRERTQFMILKKIICKFSLFFKNVSRQIVFLEIVSFMKINKNCLYVCVQSGGGGLSN